MKTGRTWLKSMPDDCKNRTCPECGKDCRGVALVNLVYTWEVCNCGKVDYEHLSPTLHHRDCFLKCKEADTCKATVQMDALNRVCTDGGMDLDIAISELQLDDLKYARLAKREDLHRVAKEIRAVCHKK